MTLAEINALLPSWLLESEVYSLVITDLEGKYIFVNQIFKKRFSFITDNFVGLPFTDTIHPDDIEKCNQAAFLCITETEKNVQLQVRKPDSLEGDFYWTNWEFSLFKNANQEPVGILCIGHDITEVQRAGFKVKQYAEKAEKIVENITDGFFVVDKNWRYVEISKVSESVIGIPKEMLIGKLFWDFFPDSTEFQYPEQFRKAMQMQISVTFEEFIPILGRWFLTTAYPSQEGLAIFYKDITEEKKVLKTLQHMKTLLDETGKIAEIGGWEYDVENDILSWTDQTFRIHEVDYQYLPTIEASFNFYHPDHQPLIRGVFEKLLSTGESFEIKLKFITATKKLIWVKTIGKVLSREKNIKALIGTIQNITALKETEIALQESQSSLKIIAENVPGAIMQSLLYPDGSNKILYISSGCYRLWEVSPQDALHNEQLLWDMVHLEDLEEMQISWQEASKKLTHWFFQWRIKTPSGKDKWLEANGLPTVQIDETILWHIVITDITNAKKAEKQIKDSEYKLRAILDSTTESNILISLDLQVLSCNKVAREETRTLLNQEIQVGDDFRIFLDFFDERISRLFYQSYHKALKGEKVIFEDYIEVNGQNIWFQWVYFPVYDENDKIIGISFNSKNIDKRKRIEEQIIAQNETLKQITWMQSHSVRRPVANILGLVTLLKDDVQADETMHQKYLEYIYQSAKELDEIIAAIVRKAEQIP